MEVTAKARYIHKSPRKVRLVCDAIRGLSADQAVIQLQLMNKGAAPIVLKLLQSAMANAKHNFSIDEATLKVKTIMVDQGPTMKRFKPRAFGRATPIRKRMSHVTIVLEGEEQKKAAAPKAKKPAAKKETKAPVKKKPAAKTKKTESSKKTKA